MIRGISDMRNMFVFDLDGTIIIDNQMLDSVLYETLKSLEKRKEKIVFATSRSLRGVKKSTAKAIAKSSVNFVQWSICSFRQ